MIIELKRPTKPEISRILAVDAGYACTGWAKLDYKMGDDGYRAWTLFDAGTIETRPLKTDRSMAIQAARRCEQLASWLHHFCIGTGERRPDLVVAEMPHGGAKSARAIAGMARAGAVLAAVCRINAVPLVVVSPREVKLVTTGRPKGSKKEVMEGVRRRWEVPHYIQRKKDQEAVCDAIGAFMAWHAFHQFDGRMGAV